MNTDAVKGTFPLLLHHISSTPTLWRPLRILWNLPTFSFIVIQHTNECPHSTNRFSSIKLTDNDENTSLFPSLSFVSQRFTKHSSLRNREILFFLTIVCSVVPFVCVSQCLGARCYFKCKGTDIGELFLWFEEITDLVSCSCTFAAFLTQKPKCWKQLT